MSKKLPEFLAKEFDAKSAEDVVKAKQEKPQHRAYTAAPAPVAMTADECRSYCRQAGVTYLDGYEGRVLQYTITDESVDRYGDIVRAGGLDVDNYKKNPTILYQHKSDQLPVGKCIKIWHDLVENKWKAWGLFADDRTDTTGVAEATFRMASSGFLPACSIGFVPKKTAYPTPAERAKLGMGDWGVEYIESELLEWSPVAVPANPNAVQEGLKSGAISRKDIATLHERGILPDDYAETLKSVSEQASELISEPAIDSTIGEVVKVTEKDITLMVERAVASALKLAHDKPETIAKYGATISAATKAKLTNLSAVWNKVEEGLKNVIALGEEFEKAMNDILGAAQEDEDEDEEATESAKSLPAPDGGSAPAAAPAKRGLYDMEQLEAVLNSARVELKKNK